MLFEERANELLVPSDKIIKSLVEDISTTLRPQSFIVNTTIGCHI